jgi:cyanophycin synthetase
MVLSAVDVGAVAQRLRHHPCRPGRGTSREGLALVKQEVVRRARKLAVLNADDPLCLRMAGCLTARRLCLVTEHEDRPEVREHRARNGLAVLLAGGDGGVIRLVEGERQIGGLDAASIPAAWGGAFRRR